MKLAENCGESPNQSVKTKSADNCGESRKIYQPFILARTIWFSGGPGIYFCPKNNLASIWCEKKIFWPTFCPLEKINLPNKFSCINPMEKKQSDPRSGRKKIPGSHTNPSPPKIKWSMPYLGWSKLRIAENLPVTQKLKKRSADNFGESPNQPKLFKK